jgi:hypothetical protein
MQLFAKKLFWPGCFVLFAIIFYSCDKVDVTLDDSNSAIDPNITYFDNYTVDIATYKPDSFLTSSHEIFCVGAHTDPVFGKVMASSYAEIALPITNSVLAHDVQFDSLELILKSTGQFYGDSALPFTIKVSRLNTQIQNAELGNSFYNTSAFNYNPASIGQQTFNLAGKTGELLHIRLQDNIGNDLLAKFKSGDDVISSQENFSGYFSGIVLTTGTNNNTIAYFKAGTDAALLRLHYHNNFVFSDPGYLDLNFTKARQFNHISFDHTGTILSPAFIVNKQQLIPSTDSHAQSFLNSNLGSSIKISFPTLLNLKELHPYVEVIKAELVIRPDTKSLSVPYSLPQALQLYTTDDTNALSSILGDPETGSAQTGKLFIDYLYGENTAYSFDITTFINSKIKEGQFSTSALMLTNALDQNDSGIQRLIMNDQSNNKSIQLKLYVLGL